MRNDPRDGDLAQPMRDELARRVASALERIEGGRVGDAQRELAQLLATLREGGVIEVARATTSRSHVVPHVDLGDPFDDAELERAFAEAEPEPDSMIDADQIAQEAMREAALDRPEGVLPEIAPDDAEGGADSPFATRTVAELLERQGHTGDARRLRERIEARPSAGASVDGVDPRERVIATLERWLENLQRGVA